MSRYFITISYQGTNYQGWQLQPNGDTIQSQLTKALSTLLRQDISVTGAGRTDAGVHALKFVAHFDSSEPHLAHNANLIRHLNHYLPLDIAVHSIKKVHEKAHSRFDALSRSYEYVISRSKDPFCYPIKYFLERQLDLARMQEASKALFEFENFASFSKGRTNVKTYICQIHKAYWFERGNDLVFYIKANRFLRNMVRAIVGTLLDVGMQKCSLDEFRRIIESRDRRNAGFSVPARGLYLTNIVYPDSVFL